MKLIKANEGTYYDAKNHYNIWGVKKLTEEDGSKILNISVSEFLPNGGALLTASVKDRVYIVQRGSMDVNTEDGTTYSMEVGDMIFIPAGEKREIKVTSRVPCQIIVLLIAVA